MLDFRGQIVSTVTTTRGQVLMQVNAVCSIPFTSYCVINATDDENFGIYLELFVQISLTSTNRKAAIDHHEFAKHWGIHPDCAKATIQCTTQRGVHKIANPALLNVFGQMIACYNTGTYVTRYSPIQCSLTCICTGIINVHRCLHLTLDGYVYIL